MKKTLALLLLLSLLLGAANGAWAGEEAMPNAVWEMMDAVEAQGYRAADWAMLESLGWAFAVFQNGEGHNLLAIYRKTGGEWREYLKTDKALPQGTKILGVGASEEDYDGLRDFIGLTREGPYFQVWQANSDREDETEYAERYVMYALENGAWQLFYWEDYYGDLSLWATEDTLLYHGAFPGEYEYKGAVSGRIQRDARYINLSSTPRSYREALRKLTNPPALPAGELTAQTIKFTGGQKFPVYSGPGENYLRANNGKALVSTNDWIQVFGKQNGFILIQYAIEKNHMRFGWISESALPRGARVEELSFDAVPMYTAVETFMTDDPLFSQSELAGVPECSQVSWLSTLGKWAYVEWQDDGESRDEPAAPQPLRGFIRRADLARLTEEELVSIARDYLLASHPVLAGEPIGEDALDAYLVYMEYNPDTRLWYVFFDGPQRDHAWTVVVDDENGAAVQVEFAHG